MEAVVQPLGDQVLVQEIQVENETTAGGIVIPVSAANRTDAGQPLGYARRCNVLAVGLEAAGIEEGAVALVRSRAGAKLQTDRDVHVFLVDAKDVLALVR